MEIVMQLEYRDFEEKEFKINGDVIKQRLLLFLMDDSNPIRIAVRENDVEHIKSLGLKKSEMYNVYVDAKLSPVVTNDMKYGRDNYVVSNRQFNCSFTVNSVAPFAVSRIPGTAPDKGGK